MRRALIFLLILTIPIGFLLGAHRSIDALQDDVEVGEEYIYGDPGRLAGVSVQLLTTCGDHMWWDTGYTAGEPGVTQTQFHFTQNYHERNEIAFEQEDFAFFATSGTGMSISGDTGFDLSGEGLGVLAAAVAERTQPGESRSEQLRLADYVDVYPMEYWVHIFTDSYIIDANHNALSDSVWEQEEDDGGFSKWMELFRFPVEPDGKMEVRVEKDLNGAVRSLHFSLIDGPDLGFTTVIQDEGMYFATVFQSWAREPILTGEFPEGYGLYYIPFKAKEGSQVVVEGDGYQDGTFDFDNLKLIYALAPTDEVVAMEMNADGTVLHMLVRQQDAYRYLALDLGTGQIAQQVDILPAAKEEQDCSYRFFMEQELLYVTCGSQVALVNISDQPKVELTAAWPGEVQTAPLPDSVLFRDGELYMAALDWFDDGRGFCMAVWDDNGLGCYGRFITNLHHNDRFYGASYISLDSVEIVGA